MRGGLEMVPAGPHKPCNVGSNPTPATYRDVAQVVARVIWDHEAAGSSPVIPTQNMMSICSWKGEPSSMFTLLTRKPHTMREMAPVRRNDWSFRNMRSYRKTVGPWDDCECRPGTY